MFRQFNSSLFFSPPDAPIGGVVTPSSIDIVGKEDIVDFLKDENEDEQIPLVDKDKKPIKKDEKKEEKKGEKKEVDDEDEDEDEEKKEKEEDDEVDELKELEEDLEGPTEEQLELMTPVRRRDILKKYPNVFKDFPYLENAYYREQQFTEIFPTPADAKEASEAKDTLNRFETELVSGNIENILKATKTESPKSFNKIVDNYLDALGRVDPTAHTHIIGNIIKHTVMSMAAEGKRKNNKELGEAAERLYEYVFGTSDFVPPSKLNREVEDKDDSENNKLKSEKQAFVKQQFEITNNDLNTRVNNSIKKTIEANIDPKTTMTDYVRRNASRDAMDTLTELIEKDTRFKKLVDRLWEKAFESSFSRNTIDAIKSAYFSKAKTLLPAVIKKARNEALKGMGKRVKEEDSTPDEKESNEEKERPRSHKPSGKKDEIPHGMSTLDFLNQD